MKKFRTGNILTIFLVLMAFLAHAAVSGGNDPALSSPSTSPTGATSVVTSPEVPTPVDPVTSKDISSAANPDPDNTTPTSPTVTDHSFWRLAKQGEVTLPRRIADSIQLGQEWYSTRCHELADFPELDFVNSSSDQPMENYVIHSDTAHPGEIVCRLHYAETDYIISVPVLDDALSEYLRECGASCVMSYGRHADGSQEAELAFYRNSTYILVSTNPNGCIPLAGTGYFGCFAGFGSYATSKDLDQLAWGGDVVSVPCYGDGCCSDSSIKILYDQTAGQIMREQGTEPDSTICVVVDQLAEFTETSYTASPIQLQALKDAVAEFESRPLPDFVLEKLTD